MQQRADLSGINRENSGNQSWDATLYDSQHNFVWKYGAGLVEILDPRPGERILDLGCGTGHLAQKIAETGARVVGLDGSSSMVDEARRLYPELEFLVGDGANFHFSEPFDAVFSNATLHWIKNSTGVIASLWENLKPGGRFVAEFGGKGNVASIIEAVNQAREALGSPARPEFNPWYFPALGEYASLLEKQGFEVRQAFLFDRPTRLEEGEAGLGIWLKMFGKSLLTGFPADSMPELLEMVERRLKPQLFREEAYFADYRRLRVVAVKPGPE